jgi:hypothetical protein
LSSNPSKPERLGERLLTSRWRSPASSSSRARQALWWRPPLPLQRFRTLLRRAPVPSRRVPPLLCLPRALAPLPPLQLLVRGAQDSTSQGGMPPVTFFFFPRRRVLRGRRGRKSLLLAQPILLVMLFPTLPPPDPPLLLARRPLLHPSLHRTRGCSGSRRGQVGPRGVNNHPLLKTTIKTEPVRCEEMRGEDLLTTGASGSITNDQRSSLLCLTALRLMARPHPHGPIFLREAIGEELRACQRRRVGCLAHLVNAELPLHEGTIRRWWRFARTEAAPNPASARFFNAARSESSHAWCEEGDTPWCQESPFSISTLPV